MKIAYFFSKIIKKIYIPAIKESDVSPKAKICSGAHVVLSKIGRYSYVGNYSTILNCKIGQFCSIGDRCTIGGMSHPMEWVSTSPVMYAGHNCLKTNFSNKEYKDIKETIIDNDVWIGEDCLIKAGIHISTGSVIGMGSVLTKDTKPYEIWAGNPAKMIRHRFAENLEYELLNTKWWDWDDEQLRYYADVFDSPAEFVHKYKNFKKVD